MLLSRHDGTGKLWPLFALLLTQLANVDANANSDALQTAKQQNQAQGKAPLLAREALLRPETISDVQMSPDGRFLLFRQHNEQQSDLMLRAIDNEQLIRVQADAQRVNAQWSGDSQTLWLADPLGLSLYDIASQRGKRLWKWDEKRRQQFWGVESAAPNFALMREKVADGNRWLYRYLLLDRKGQMRVLHESRFSLHSVAIDTNGELLYSIGYEGDSYDKIVRRYQQGKSRELMRCVGVQRCQLVGHDDQRLFVLGYHNEKTGGDDKLQLQSRTDTSITWQTLHRDPSDIADASAVLWSAHEQNWLAVAYHPDRRRWYGNGEQRQKQIDVLQAQLPDASLYLQASENGKRWLVQAKRADWPFDRYFLFMPETLISKPLFENETKSELTATMVKAIPFSYRAGDDMLLHAYVFLPKGVALNKAPIVANLHGGPYNRDRDDYTPITQLLVNRGYVVVTPNFRASTGYGLHYLLSAGGDFGKGKVLQDIIDSLDHLLAQGIGDRKQQAVIGHSFGGYASLLAVSHFPHRFRFAVASAAPMDFYWGMGWIAKNGGSALPADGPPAELFFHHHGMPFTDKHWQQQMRDESPWVHIKSLQTPLYLWAGAKDDRVPLKEVVHYAGDVKRHGKPLTLLIDPDTGHNPDDRLNFEALVYLIEAAADQHFSGGLTPPASLLKRFVEKHTRIDSNQLVTDQKP